MSYKKGKDVKKKSKFGMLSVKAGIDKNPNPTQADRQKKSYGWWNDEKRF